MRLSRIIVPPWRLAADARALVLRDNLRFRQTFERAYLLGITEARRDIPSPTLISFPGVIPPRPGWARGGVRLLLQGKVEYRM